MDQITGVTKLAEGLAPAVSFEGPEILAATIGVAWVIALSICLVLAWRNFRRSRRDAANASVVAAAEDVVLEFITTPSMPLPLELDRSSYISDLLSRVGSRLSGDYRLRILVLYTALGFTGRDMAFLRQARLREQVHALKRCRELQIPLPDSLWQLLLNHRSRTMRWAAMDYLITTKGKKALPWILDFLGSPTNRSRGMAMHLISELGAASPASLLTLLDHADGDFLAGVVLEALGIYPVPGSEERLIAEAQKQYTSPIFYPALQAAVAVPAAATNQFLLALVQDYRTEVRILVAQHLAAYPNDTTVAALLEMATDFSYEVRFTAVKSLIEVAQNLASGDDIFASIETSELHPSHGALHAIRLLHQPKRVA